MAYLTGSILPIMFAANSQSNLFSGTNDFLNKLCLCKLRFSISEPIGVTILKPTTELAFMRMLLSKATEFEILPQIVIKRRIQRDGSVKWAVYRRGYALDKKGEWQLEPIPSSRTDEFLADTRFELADAWERAQAAALRELKPSQQSK
jgi:hypothetical protein